jgi:hypothetical protein
LLELLELLAGGILRFSVQFVSATSIYQILEMPPVSSNCGRRRDVGAVIDVDGNHLPQQLLLPQQQHDLPLIIQRLKDKLARGDELNPEDLRSLMPLHDDIASRNDDGVKIGNDNPINYLDRSFLYGGQHHPTPTAVSASESITPTKSASTFSIANVNNSRNHNNSTEKNNSHDNNGGGGPQLVRYLGMVQDMLDPEYYPSKVNGKSAHFHDWNPFTQSIDEEDGDDGQASEGWSLAERVPLVIVPIPFATQWMLHGLATRKTSETVAAPLTTRPINMASQQQPIVVPPTPQHPMIENRKRGRGEEEEMWQDDHPNQSKKGNAHHHPRRRHSDIHDIHSPMVDSDDDVLENKISKDGNDDWWPAGTCGTSVEDCPVLAKLCYDQLFRLDDHNETACSGNEQTRNNHKEDTIEHMQEQHPPRHSQERQRLRLNDLVSLVGVLSPNPWEGDCTGRHLPEDDDNDDTFMNGMTLLGVGANSSIDSCTPRLPSPSRLPRLHVLSYKHLDLDDLAAHVARNGNHSNRNLQMTDPIEIHSMSVVNENDDHDTGASGIFPPPPPQPLFSTPVALTHHLMAGWDPIVTQAIWMTLLSKAERRRDTPSNGLDSATAEVGADDSTRTSLFRVGPSERALGCLSLQISTPDLATSRSYFDHLASDILPALCPVVVAIERDGHRCIIRGNNNMASMIASPTKDENGRMRPSPLQLPAGAVVLVLYHPTISDCGNDSNSSTIVDRHIVDVKTVLHELVQSHRLPYTFEGNVTIQFEADYRVIIVTTQTQSLPCSWTVFTNKGTGPERRMTGPTRDDGPSSNGTVLEQDAENHNLMGASSSNLIALQEALCIARLKGSCSIGSSICGVRLNASLLEQAQQDFLERRRQHSNCGGRDGTAIGRSLPGEDDFHRWLNLAKLQSMSRYVIRGLSLYESANEEVLEASVEDWQDALQLDDIIQAME